MNPLGLTKRTAFAILFIWTCAHARAEEKVEHTEVTRNIRFANVTAESGLSQEFVHTVVQDGQGYIWFGTQRGLNRFDGQDIVVYEHDPKNSRSLTNSFIWSLFVDVDDRLWVATASGINRYDYATDSFVRSPFPGVSLLDNLRIRTVMQDRQGVFWFGTLDDGLISIDPVVGTMRHFVHEPGNPNSLPDDSIMAIQEDRKGRLWVGTDGGGLARLDRITELFVVYRNDPVSELSLSDDRIRSIYEDHYGRIWIGTAGGGLNLFDVTTGQFQRFIHHPDEPDSLSTGQVSSIIEDARGTLWVGTETGLNEWQPQTRGFLHYRNRPEDPSSLANDRVNSIFEDASGVLWIATHGGVSRWNYFSDIFSYYSSAEGFLQGDIVTSIAETSDGVLWIGTYGTGMSSIDMPTGEVTHYRKDSGNPDGLTDDRVMSLHVDQADRLWIGTRNAGLSYFDQGTNKFIHFRHDSTDDTSLSGDAITSIHSDPDGTLWVGIYGGGLNRLESPESGKFERFRHDDQDSASLSSDRVLALHRDRLGVLWVGTEGGGLNRFDPKTQGFSSFGLGEVNGLSETKGTAWEIVESRDGTLWIGTMAYGLVRWLEPDRRDGRTNLESFSKAEGLTSGIYGIVEGAANELWLSSDQGITRFDPDQGLVRHFDRRNGLRGNEFNQGARLRSRTGTLYFGSTDGLVGFFPSELPRNQRAPAVSLIAESRDTRIARSDGKGPSPIVELGYLDPFVAFEFVALDFVSPDKNLYRYKLEGFDDVWIEGGDRFRRAVYTNLPAGDYTFRVQAANNDAVWNEEGASIRVSVIPPPWNTGWAYLAYLLCLISLFGWYLRNQRRKARQVKEQRVQLEHLVAERTQELAQRNTELQSLNDQLAEASVTDSLTGLHNRRFVDQFIDSAISMVERRQIESREKMEKEPTRDSSKLLFFMMIDLDGFKQINDSYGHHAGDRALVEVKDRLLECCRGSDAVVRWGGDEFMIIGHASGFTGTKILAERIRENIAEQEYEVDQNHFCRLSASIGVTAYPFGKDAVVHGTWEQLAAVADQGAYLAKANGRNAWVSIRGTEQFEPNDLARLSKELVSLVDEGKLMIDSSLDGGIELGVSVSAA